MPNATDHMTGLTHETLKAALTYAPEIGEFRWLNPIGKKRGILIGTIAGHPHAKTGYRRICINKRMYRANRLAWLYMTGEWPTHDIDHKDSNRSNDAWDNLRAATNSQNKANEGLRSTNSSGVKGVYWDKTKRKWAARIMKDYKEHFLGRFTSINAAADAYAKAAQTMFGEFASSPIQLEGV